MAYREPVEGEYYLMEGIHLHGTGRCEEMLIIEKIKPHRIVLEETEEDSTITQFIDTDNVQLHIQADKIWRVINTFSEEE